MLAKLSTIQKIIEKVHQVCLGKTSYFPFFKVEGLLHYHKFLLVLQSIILLINLHWMDESI